ncbi:MAG: hypothetical protein RIQ65_135 [Pseudomonadota bacterium]
MNKEYYSTREKKLYESFSENNDFFSNNYFGETKPILDKLIENAEKRIISSLSDALMNAKDEVTRKEIKEILDLFTTPKILRDQNEVQNKEIVKNTLPAIEKHKKPVQNKEIIFSQPKKSSVNSSRYIYWCNPHTSINIGKLGSSQAWRIEKPEKSYY